MGKKIYSLDFFKNFAKKKGGDCLSNKYISTQKKLKWICKDGYVWEVRPSNILSGTWCPHCDGQSPLSIEDLNNLAIKKGGKLLSKKYINSKTKYKWQCSKGHIWKTAYGNIKKGTWCVECYELNPNKKRKHSKKPHRISKYTIQEVRKIAKKRGGKCISKSYKNTKSKLKWKCKEGHIWETSLGTVLNGNWCNKCHFYHSEELCRTALEQILNTKFYKSKPTWLVNSRGNQMELDGHSKNLKIAFEYQGIQHFKLTSFINTKQKLKQRIYDDRTKINLCKKKGIKLLIFTYKEDLTYLNKLIEKKLKIKEINGNPINYKKVINFNHVYKHKSKIKEMNDIAIQRGGECLSKVYVNSMTKMTWKCKKGHKWKATPYSIKIRDSWCFLCSPTGTLTIDEMSEIAEKNNGECLSKTYKPRKKLKWRCSKNHIFKALPQNIKNGQWCSICKGNAKLSIDQMHELAKNFGGLCLSKNYKNNYTKLKWQCSKGHKWMATPHLIKIRNTWCKICSSEKRKKEFISAHSSQP